MSERKRCRWFHRWDDLDVFVDMFSTAYQCRKCGYCKVTNLFTERTTYGWRKDGAR